jgi:hypothetical protein
MEWNWFDLHWCWIGLAMSAVLLVLLFATNIFRTDRSRSRWLDPVWLAWLAPATYIIHQFEEYGIDAQGVRFVFPNLLSHSMGLPPYPDSTLPGAIHRDQYRGHLGRGIDLRPAESSASVRRIGRPRDPLYQ